MARIESETLLAECERGPTAIDTPRPGAAAVVRFGIAPDTGLAVRPAGRPQGRKAALVTPKATILVVDDESAVREVLEEYFVAHGYAAFGAESADAAKALVARQPIDLALVDIHM